MQVELRALQLGMLLVVLLSAPYKAFDLDRFFVTKEIVLHATALVVGTLAVSRARRLAMGRADELLAIWILAGLASALFAHNWWLAGRALALSTSAIVLFWSARSLAQAGAGRQLVSTVALAGIVGALTALAQAYGLRSEFMSLNRAPGGTFGNRNFMAHLCVMTLPALLVTATRAPSRASLLRWSAGAAAIGAALILSRSRAAWLALIGGTLVLVVALAMASMRLPDTVRWRRMLSLIVGGVIGAALAIVMPNALDWSSDSPYADTAHGLVNYREGSGHGRLVQYGNSLRMTLHHPILGVGPGNWAVAYPGVAAAGDPSLADDGMTSNPWPSSDLVTWLSERGPAAFAVLALAMLTVVVDSVRHLRDPLDPDRRVDAALLLASLAAIAIVGAFDAVMVLPIGALIGWSLIGTLAPEQRERRAVAMGARERAVALALLLIFAGGGTLRSTRQLLAMRTFSSTTRTAVLEEAAALDPGSYRIRIRLAEAYLRRGQCTKSRPHAAAAHDLYPAAPRARRLLARCGG